VAGLVGLPAVAAAFLGNLPVPQWLLAGVVVYLAVGARSLAEHARAVAGPLAAGDLTAARTAVGRLVSRDPAQLDSAGVARAGIESVLENGADAVFGALFWFAVAGLPGLVAYRLSNTLDAMWGYRTPRFEAFGRAAARLDDGLNWPVARLTAVTYALAGRTGEALRCWRTQARAWKSPNAGVVMAAGAGALGIRLGGPARYHGKSEDRPVLGMGIEPGAADLRRAVSLVHRGLVVWLLIIVLGGWLLA
jgi:adenosylcobinamide-phosphate synthase